MKPSGKPFALVSMFVISASLTFTSFANAQSAKESKPAPTPVLITPTKHSTDHSPKTKAAKKPDSKIITECDAGDSKCMENHAKGEVKPTDGAIQQEKK